MAFKIETDESFWADVTFRRPGGKESTLKVNFIYRDADSYFAFFREGHEVGRSDVDTALDCAKGWDAEMPFDKDSVIELFRKFPTAARAFFTTYREEIFGAAEKN